MPGYTEKFVDKLRPVHYCPLCRFPMKDPVQLADCGHRFCDSCLQDYLDDGLLECPEDKNYLDYAKIYPDEELSQEIQTSMVKCLHHTSGCAWTDQLCNLKTHLDVCRYRPESCPNNCNADVSRASLTDHVTYVCSRRKLVCQFCGQNFSADSFDRHEGHCRYESVWCENKCGAQVQRRYLNNHMRNECHKRLEDCHYCGKEFLFETLQALLNSEYFIVCVYILDARNCERFCDYQTHQYSCPRLPVACPNRCDNTKIPRDEMDQHISDHCPAATVTCTFKEWGCQHKCPRHSMDKHLDSASKSHLTLVCRALHKQQQTISSLRMRLTSSSHVTDGTFIWRLSEYKLRLQDSKSKSGLETMSDSFYTHSYGYKMSVSAFLNGNGPGESKYLSLYLRLLPGDYDNLLEWPFVLPVTFALIDQQEDRKKRQNLVESFVPDKTWKHFQKPGRDDTMLGFGYPKFVSHEVLKTRCYVKDDCVFFRIKIDISKAEIDL